MNILNGALKDPAGTAGLMDGSATGNHHSSISKVTWKIICQRSGSRPVLNKERIDCIVDTQIGSMIKVSINK